MREVMRLLRDEGSLKGRLVTRNEDGDEETSEAMPWADVLAQARDLAGPGAQVMVHVLGEASSWYGRGYGKLTEYPVQLRREPKPKVGP